MSKRILFLVADLADEENLRRAMTACAASWRTLVVRTAAEAMLIIRDEPVDVIVAEFKGADRSSATVLNWASEHHPNALRLIMALPEEREEVMRAVLGQHHFLPKPVAPDVLAGTIQSALSLDSALPNDQLRKLAARIRVFPPIPSLYFQVMSELKSPNFSAQTVGEIVAQDMAMTTRLLQVLNSGFYSLPRQITDPTEAVSLLGLEMVKSLIISINVFLKHDHLKPLYFSISQVWRHSTAVANAARQITLMETGNTEWADDAYTAGLLHDIGKLVLANNFEQQYNEAQKKSRALNKPLWEVETETFGVSHAELGAFLLGRWGMPVGLLGATALHHQPRRSDNREFSALTAVHVANALEQEMSSKGDGPASSALDTVYLEELGLADRVDTWRKCLRTENGFAKQVAPHSSPARPGETRASTQFPNPSVAGAASRKIKWFAAAMGVAAAVSLAWYLHGLWATPEIIPARARPLSDNPGLSEPASGDGMQAEERMNPLPIARTNVTGALPPQAPAGETSAPPPQKAPEF